MKITQEQAKIIYGWWGELLASNNTSGLRGSDYDLARVIYDASQQSVQRTGDHDRPHKEPCGCVACMAFDDGSLFARR